MTKYYNGKGGSDVTREYRREARLDRMQAIEDYEQLCRQFRRMANEKGFIFPGQIWLKRKSTNKMYMNG